jgi:vacuolar protein sorting-associated protein 35
MVRSAADLEQLAEEQGWVARIVHLFRAEQLDVQYELFRTARKHFERGGDRMRFTFPSLITAAIALARRYKQREHEVSTRAWVPLGLGTDQVVGT